MSILTATASAVINFLLMFGLCCAYGIIMFEDPWNKQHRGMAVKMNLSSALIVGLLLATCSKCPVAIGGPDLNPVVFLGMFVQTLADAIAREQGLVIPHSNSRRLLESCNALLDFEPLEAMRRLGASSYTTVDFCVGDHLAAHLAECSNYHNQLRATTIFAVSVSSLIFGILFFSLGRLRITRFVSYVPTNIMEAFLSCVGYKVFKYALKFCKYKPQQFIPAACVGVPLYFLKALHLANPAVAIPIVLLVPLGVFYTVVYAQGGNLETARSAGWMFDQLENEDFWTVWTASLGSVGDINFRAWTSCIVDLLVMIVVVMLDAMLKLSSTENKLPVKVDKDYESQLYGVGNFLTTLFGSSVGYMQLKFNVINYGVMGNVRDRRGGILYALSCGVLFFWTTDLINYLPRFFLSTLLFFAGSGFVVENLWGSRKYLSTAEWLQIFIILAVFIFANSLLYAVITGGVITGATFIVRYANISNIVGRPMLGGEVHSTLKRNYWMKTRIEHVANRWVLVIHLKGFIFFASAQKLTGWVSQYVQDQHKAGESGLAPHQRTRYLIFDCSQLDGLDSSASKAFVKFANFAKDMRINVLWCGMPDEMLTQMRNAEALGFGDDLFNETTEAMDHIEGEILNYLRSMQEKWLQVHPMFALAHQEMRDRMALEPFEDIFKLDTARLGCPWQYCSRVEIKAYSTLLWAAGERRKTLYLVHSGKVGLFTNIPANTSEATWEQPLAVFARGQLINREALLNRPTRGNAVALEDGELLCWSEVQWAKMAREHPTMAAAVTQALLAQDEGEGPSAPSVDTSALFTLNEEPKELKRLRRGSRASGFGSMNLEDLLAQEPREAARTASMDANHMEDMRPTFQGLHMAKGLADLGLFEDPGSDASLRLTPFMTEYLEKDLRMAFHTFKDEEVVSDKMTLDPPPPSQISGLSNIGEALMYAGLLGLGFVSDDLTSLTEAEFIALGLELATARLSKTQVAKLEDLYRDARCEDDIVVTSTGIMALLREKISVSAEEVDDDLSLCGAAPASHIDADTFVAMMARLVRRHERDWCMLLGIRHLLGKAESPCFTDRLTSELLVEKSMTELQPAEAEELLWCANISGGEGSDVDIRAIVFALWPLDVPKLELPPEPRRIPTCWIVRGSKDGACARSYLSDVRSQQPGGNADQQRLRIERIYSALPARLPSVWTEASIELEEKTEHQVYNCRGRMRLFLDFPASSRAAARWALVNGMLIIMSCFVLVVQPLFSPKAKPQDRTEEAVWEILEVFFTVVFTMEVLARFAVADALGDQTMQDFLKSPMNICDIIAVLPWYVDLVLKTEQASFRLFRIARLLRLARLIRLGRLVRINPVFAPISVTLTVIWGIFLKSEVVS